MEIRTPFFSTDHPIRVRVPTVDNLLADKLTAFAPGTIGQEYSVDHPGKIIKHLFDIGELFNVADRIHSLRDVYERIAITEIGYRQGSWQVGDCLDDTIETARLVTGLAVNRDDLHPANAALLRRGIDELTGHLLGIKFTTRHAAVAAGKTASLASVIKHGATGTPIRDLRYDESKLPLIRATKPLNDPIFAKLAQISPEAFYYWWLVDSVQ